MNELTKVATGELLTEADIDLFLKADEYSKRLKVWLKANGPRIQKFFEDNDIVSYKQGGAVLYRTKDYTKKQVDIKALKEQGLYDQFTKDVWVKGSLRVQADYEDD